MKTEALKKIIKEAVREAIQEELKEVLLEAVRAPKQPIQENKNILIFKIYEDGSVEKEIIID